jgi:membrane protein required for colicin V production
MNPFDVVAGLVLVVSALVGWMQGGTREVANVLAFVLAAVIAFLALRFSGPIAHHAIHTAWLANIAAILIVFVAAYILLRVAASAVTRRIHQTKALSGVDRAAGAGFGLVRALVILGLANLAINAVTPADRMPKWISGAALFPVSSASAQTLKAFAPHGVRLARQVAPVVGRAITDKGDTDDAENRDYNQASEKSLRVRVEKSR